VAKEVCEILELNNVTEALRHLDDDEKDKIRNSDVIPRRGNPNVVIISEPGIYELIFRSRKPEARNFKRWITHIVIPEIRTTGGFTHATADLTDEEIMVLGFNANNVILCP